MSTTWKEYRVLRRNGEHLGDYTSLEDAKTTVEIIGGHEKPPYEREPIIRQRTVQASDWEPVWHGQDAPTT